MRTQRSGAIWIAVPVKTGMRTGLAAAAADIWKMRTFPMGARITEWEYNNTHTHLILPESKLYFRLKSKEWSSLMIIMLIAAITTVTYKSCI